MSTRGIILAFLPSFCKKIIKIGGNLTKFFETRCRLSVVEYSNIRIHCFPTNPNPTVWVYWYSNSQAY